MSVLPLALHVEEQGSLSCLRGRLGPCGEGWFSPQAEKTNGNFGCQHTYLLLWASDTVVVKQDLGGVVRLVGTIGTLEGKGLR